MSSIAGTIRGVNLMRKSDRGLGTRELWLVSADFGAHTAGDTAAIAGVGAAITARVRDGKTRTLRWAAPSMAGSDTAGLAVYMTSAGTGNSSLTISTDDLQGQLGSATGAVAAFAASNGVTIAVACDVS